MPESKIHPSLRALTVPIDSVREDPANARVHGERNLDVIKRSFLRFGQRQPIVVQKQGMVVRAGNARLRAARELGWIEIAAIVVDEPNIDAKAYAVLDNRSAELADWDDQALAKVLDEIRSDGSIDLSDVGYSAGELDELLEDLASQAVKDGDIDEDEIPVVRESAISRAGDLWICGRHRVLCGDSTKQENAARLMNGKKARLIVTDPPYGVSLLATKNGIPRPGFSNYQETWGDTIAQDSLEGPDLQAFLDKVFRAFLPFLDRAAWYLWHAPLIQGHFAAAAAAAVDILLHRQIIWKKPSFVLTRSGMYHWIHEPCFYGWVRGQPPAWYGDKSQTSVWELNRATDRQHPTTKPVEVYAIPIRNHLRKGEVLVDPFLGSGTALAAAEQLDVCAYGIEIEPRFVDVTLRRWQQLSDEEPLLDGKPFSQVQEERQCEPSDSSSR